LELAQKPNTSVITAALLNADTETLDVLIKIREDENLPNVKQTFVDYVRDEYDVGNVSAILKAWDAIYDVVSDTVKLGSNFDKLSLEDKRRRIRRP